jgi:hypothetical protein
MIADCRTVTGRGILRNHGRSSNSPGKALAVERSVPRQSDDRLSYTTVVRKFVPWLGVEQTFAWLNQFCRLRAWYERCADTRETFALGCAMICWHHIPIVSRTNLRGATISFSSSPSRDRDERIGHGRQPTSRGSAYPDPGLLGFG